MRLVGTGLLLLMCVMASCAAASKDTSWVELGGSRYSVELALDEHSRMRGLMFRESMPRDAGMLFVFERELPLAFWMKNTLIPLDIIYFDARGQLVSVAADTPPCTTPYCPSYPSAGAARYVLELNAGEAARLNVSAGDRLEFGPGIPGAPLD